MKKFLIIVIVIVAVVAMAKTVPDKKAHKKAMMEAVKEYVDEEATNRMGDNVLTDLGKGIVNKTVEVALNSKLEVDNYLICNTTHVKMGDETKVLSFGILGHVFTFDKQMLREALESSAK